MPSLEAEETSNPDPEAEEGPDPEAHTNTKQQKLNMTVLTSKPRGVSLVLRWGREGRVTLRGDVGVFFLEGVFTKWPLSATRGS